MQLQQNQPQGFLLAGFGIKTNFLGALRLLTIQQPSRKKQQAMSNPPATNNHSNGHSNGETHSNGTNGHSNGHHHPAPNLSTSASIETLNQFITTPTSPHLSDNVSGRWASLTPRPNSTRPENVGICESPSFRRSPPFINLQPRLGPTRVPMA